MSTDMNKLFEETVAGRMRLARNISSAPSWIPKEGIEVTKIMPNTDGSPSEPKSVIPYDGVPRPDKSISTLWWLSVLPFTAVLGLDHFYLRSPWTGIAKLFTLGGFGLWWLWDMMQVSFEKDRVLNYGLSTPFDYVTGIAQGMIHDDKAPSFYEQQTSYGLWFLATLFGFTGIDSIMLGRSWLGIRKLIIFVILMSVVVPMIATSTWSFWGLLVLLLFNQEILGLFASWGSDVYTLIAKTDTVMMRGMPVPEVAYDAFAWIKRLYVTSKMYGSVQVDSEVSEELRPDWAALKEHYMFKKEGITPEELRARFWIGRTGEKASLPTRSNDPPGNPPVTIAFRMIQILWNWIIFGIKLIIWCFVPTNAVAEAAANVGVAKIQAEARDLSEARAVDNSNLYPKIVEETPRTKQAKAQAKAALESANEAERGRVGAAGLYSGGAREEPLSTEAQIMGATVIALIAGGSLKGLVDYLMKE